MLIITDGEICDMPLTKHAIVDCCDLPMSIIIIGVGNANFSSMIELDGDDGLTDYAGRKATRDLVQFVSMKECSNYYQNTLAENVLKELPN
jgi:copine 5/8/9